MKLSNKAIHCFMAVLLLISVSLVVKETAEFVMGRSISGRQKCVVIDAGHGGTDPGKVGINGALEKDINLNIAKRLEEILTAQDIKVVMTRTQEGGLYDQDASNKKVQDMRRRIEIIEEVKPDLVVSIHQNSYQEESVCGAQVFYYTNSKESEQLAQVMQKEIITGTKQVKEREAKPNSSYYLLKKTSVPIIIVECGFLSNREEAEKLCTQYYQEKLAWSVHMGIMKYINGAG